MDNENGNSSGQWKHNDALLGSGSQSDSSRNTSMRSESLPERAEMTPAMREFVEDEVVLSLYEQNLLTWPEVFNLVRSSPAGATLWRKLAKEGSVDSAMVYFEAARLFGVPMADLTESEPPDDIIRSILDLFEPEVVSELFARSVLPIEIVSNDPSGSFSHVIATFDPLGIDAEALGQLFGKPIELQYASEKLIQLRIRRLNSAPAESTMAPELEEELMISTALDDDFFNTFIAPNLPDFEGMLGDESSMPGGIGPQAKGQSSDASDTFGSMGAIETSGEPVSGWSVSGAGVAGEGGSESGGFDHGIGDDGPTVLDEIDFGGDDSDSNMPSPEQPSQPEREIPDDRTHADLNIRDRVVVMLLHKQVVTPKQVEKAQKAKKSSGKKEALWRFLAASARDIEREAIYAEAAAVYAFRNADIGPGKPDPDFVNLVIEALSEENRDKLLDLRVLPVAYGSDTTSGGAKLVLATHDPARPDLHRFLQQLRMGRFELQYAPESQITEFYRELMPKKNEYLERITDDPLAVDLGMSFEAGEKELIDEEALEAEISRSSLINLFEAALIEATRNGASDIHIFPNAQRKIDIYFRVDGRLSKWHTEDRVHPESFLAVVKDNAMNVDRFERDMAQDGFIQRQIDDALIRFRVSVLPIATASQEVRAESIVIRVLDDRKVLTDLRKLGMLDVALERFDKAIHQPHGMVILTGPTGSGKSTTLVAALHQVVSPEVNVLTVEDPVEYIIKGVRQIKLSHKLSLEGALRAILRHDPDIVMVGEMRDKDTAELAIKLANTGHLTFSTLHTNDAPSAVSRLYKMGVEPFLLAYAINLVVAQRLIRNLCPTCKIKDTDPDRVLLKSVGFSDEEIETITFYERGQKDDCPTCHGIGYKGRRAMCETLYFSREIRHMIVESGEAIDEDQIREQGRSEGMLTLLDSAREVVKMGDTSVEELIRVTSTE